jgi:hypothetical protein
MVGWDSIEEDNFLGGETLLNSQSFVINNE